MKIIFLYILFLSLFQFRLSAQVSYGGKPYPYEPKKLRAEAVSMPPFSYSRVLQELEADDRDERRKTLPVAWNFDVNLNPDNSGYWTEFPDGTNVWRLQLKSENAYAISLFFDKFELKHGARIFIYDPAMEQILGSFDHRSNKQAGNFPVAFIMGDELVVELQVDKEVEDFGLLNIGSLSHAFVNIFGVLDRKDGYFGRSDTCQIDINCPAGENWQDVKRAVTRVIFRRTSQPISELCTGTLINNTSRDQTPYYYTANHCIDREFAAQTSVFYFNYESPDCYGHDGFASQTTAGATLLSTSESLDFSLLLFEEEIPDDYNPYYAGWTLKTAPAPSAVCIHHPMGDVKKISTVSSPLTGLPQQNPPSWFIPGMFWRVARWTEGTTEGGSSGSPLLNFDKHIVGNLTGGDGTCANPVNDYFSRLHMNWDYFPDSSMQLKYWLDRTGTGLTSLNGFDPYFYPDTSKNIMEILEYFYELQDFKNLVVSAGLENMLATGSFYTVFAPVNEAFKSLPQAVLQSILAAQVEKAGELVAGHIINDKLKSESFPDGSEFNSIAGNNVRINVIDNVLFADYAKVLVPDIIASNGVVHMVNEFLFPVNYAEETFTVFPNPAKEQVWVTHKEGTMRGAVMKVYNTNGTQMADYTIMDDKLSRFDISLLPPGLYIIHIIHNQDVFVRKLIISNNRFP